ncbi:MAG: Beta-galactosidase C-terminal domain, partial [Anaerolineales bacterium]
FAQARMLEYICNISRVKPVLETPKGVEVCSRVTSEGKEVLIVINHQSYEQKIMIPWVAHDFLSGYSGKGQVKLGPYGVVVLMQE